MGRQTRKKQRYAGGRWLAEGADGCVFTAPHNWPCASPTDLPGYDPEDDTVVTKIVATDDFEERILRLFPILRKQYYLQNLPEYIGTCKPRMTRTPNVRGFFQNMNRRGKTRKGCRAWALNYEAGRPRKQYVLRKYWMTLRDFVERCKETTKASTGTDAKQMASLFADQARLFTKTLRILANTNPSAGRNPYQIIHYDMHSNNIVLFPLANKSFAIGPADFGRALWRDVRLPIDPATWDEPYYAQFVDNVHSGRYSEFSQFSLENRLVAYLASPHRFSSGTGHLNEKGLESDSESEPKVTWLERWAADPDVKNRRMRPTNRDPLYWALPYLLSVLPRSSRWRAFETKLEALVRVLVDVKSRAAVLRKQAHFRLFFDKVKARSMVPVAFGLFLRAALECCGIEPADAMRSPTSYLSVPKALHPAFALYWRSLVSIVL
jgi:hypothetical protein